MATATLIPPLEEAVTCATSAALLKSLNKAQARLTWDISLSFAAIVESFSFTACSSSSRDRSNSSCRAYYLPGTAVSATTIDRPRLGRVGTTGVTVLSGALSASCVPIDAPAGCDGYVQPRCTDSQCLRFHAISFTISRPRALR